MKIRQKQSIRTEHLELKPYSKDDRSRLAGLLMDEKITKTYMVPQFQTEQEYFNAADKLIGFSQPEDEDHMVYGIYLAGLLIGFVDECGFDEKEIELGLVLYPEYQNKGYAKEVVSAVIDDLWRMGFQRITGVYFEGNDACSRVMQKCGMMPTEETYEREYRGKIYKCFKHEILRSDFTETESNE